MKRKTASPARAPLTTEELERVTADDLRRMKLSDDEISRLREINKAREQERIERSGRLAIEQQPLLADLRRVGWDVKSVWDLVNTSTNYAEAIPVLLKHLLLPYSDLTREGIARALAVPEPEVRKAWPMLVEEYRKAPMGWGIKAPGDTKEYRLGAKDGLACALAVAATDATLEELIGIIKDPVHGSNRVLLLSALRKSKNPLAKKTLEELASDPAFAKEIASWRKR
jgi:hypothetical protein